MCMLYAWSCSCVLLPFRSCPLSTVYHSGLYTAIAGGLLFSRGALRYLHKLKHREDLDQAWLRPILNMLPDKFDPDETYLDEVIGWSIALLGFCLQFLCGFEVPGLVLQLLLSPVIIAEKVLEYYLMNTDSEQA